MKANAEATQLDITRAFRASLFTLVSTFGAVVQSVQNQSATGSDGSPNETSVSSQGRADERPGGRAAAKPGRCAGCGAD